MALGDPTCRMNPPVPAIRRIGCPHPKIAFEEIQAAIEHHFGPLDFKGPRTAEMVDKRFAFYWLASRFGNSHRAIAAFTGKERTGVIYGVQSAQDRLDTDRQYREDLEMLRSELEATRS